MWGWPGSSCFFIVFSGLYFFVVVVCCFFLMETIFLFFQWWETSPEGCSPRAISHYMDQLLQLHPWIQFSPITEHVYSFPFPQFSCAATKSRNCEVWDQTLLIKSNEKRTLIIKPSSMPFAISLLLDSISTIFLGIPFTAWVLAAFISQRCQIQLCLAFQTFSLKVWNTSGW